MAFESSLMLSVINEHQMEYETDRATSIRRYVFSELNEAEYGKFLPPLVLVQRRSLVLFFTYFGGNLNASLDLSDTQILDTVLSFYPFVSNASFYHPVPNTYK